MNILISLSVIFIISFLLIFKMVYQDNKEESKSKRLNIFLVVFVTFLLALLPTAAIALIIFVLLGATNAVNMLFALQLNMNQLMLFAIILCGYLLLIDSFIEIVLKAIVGREFGSFIIILLIRVLIFYMVGLAINLNQTNSFIIATGLAVIIALFEVLLYFRKQNNETT